MMAQTETQKKLPYEWLVIEREKGMTFPFRILAGKREIVCKQCSSCHGCR